eukprot:s975_g29.t1
MSRILELLDENRACLDQCTKLEEKVADQAMTIKFQEALLGFSVTAPEEEFEEVVCDPETPKDEVEDVPVDPEPEPMEMEIDNVAVKPMMDTKPMDTQLPPDTKPMDTKPMDTELPMDTKPMDTKPMDTQLPMDIKPMDTKPMDTELPMDTKPNDSKPNDSKPNDSKPNDSKLMELKRKLQVVDPKPINPMVRKPIVKGTDRPSHPKGLPPHKRCTVPPKSTIAKKAMQAIAGAFNVVPTMKVPKIVPPRRRSDSGGSCEDWLD